MCWDGPRCTGGAGARGQWLPSVSASVCGEGAGIYYRMRFGCFLFFFFVSLTMDKDKGKCANRTLDTSSDFGVLLKHMDFP